ncbi:MAG TPA: hypothetical protein VH087_13660 [Thermoanaerobaculia bacterium]|jgi:hypothetical protein|nr:hypothetical protein [Thermoanaerobaculia bacterium]
MAHDQVTISCSSETVAALVRDGSALVVLSAVQTHNRSGVPLVWYRTKAFSNFTELTWSPTYAAYASLNGASTSSPIKLGQRFEVAAGPVGTVENNGIPGAILLHNRSQAQYSCGISQSAPGGTLNRVCAFPFCGGNVQTIVPLPWIVLLFTTVAVTVGEPLPPEMEVSFVDQVATGTTGPALSLNLSAQPVVAVQYDVNTGWSWFSSVEGASVIDPSQIVPTLIQ